MTAVDAPAQTLNSLLNDLLDDPVVEPLLRRDGVAKDDIRHLIAKVRARRPATRPAPLAA